MDERDEVVVMQMPVPVLDLSEGAVVQSPEHGWGYSRGRGIDVALEVCRLVF